MTSRPRSSSHAGQSARASSNADATDARPTQTRVRPSTTSESELSSPSPPRVIDAAPLLLASSSPQRLDARRHKQPPFPPHSPQKKGAETSPLVWVRVTRSGELVPSERGNDEGTYWWPACVTEGRLTTGPLTISLYGEISPAASRSVRIEAPSPSQILPFKRSGQDITRFNSITFKCLETVPQGVSPSKRPKTALDEAWRSAVNLAHEADANLNDGLPSNLSSYKVGTTRIREHKKEEVLTDEAESSTDDPQTSSDRWSPPPCDPLLEIPGELVFSLARKGRTEYWAARVEQYLPPKTPSMTPKYRVRFKDDTLCAVSRDMFYTSDEPEFYTCNLGRYMSDDEESDDDSDGDHSPYETDVDEHAISIPPPNPEDFCQMSIRNQFAYIKPVIKAILNETYLPARERHQAFMRGGSWRRRLRKAATGKGDLSTRDVSRLGKVLQQWVLGPTHIQKASLPPSHLEDLESESGLSTWTDIQTEQMPRLGSPDSLNGTILSPRPFLVSALTDTGPSESLRQIGSPNYEALSESDKLQYCLLVLFHEAVLQLLLWRSGVRQSLHLLSQEEEERFHLIGLAKSEERVWVEEISRLRKVKGRKSDPLPSPLHATVSLSSSGRPLRPRTRNPPHAR